jgi:hypothetical protein
MATEVVTVSNTVWTRITTAGQSGTCWKKTGNTILIDHTDQETAATLALSNTNVTVGKSKRVPLDEDNDNVLVIQADNIDDVFYAICLDAGETADIVADVI